MRRGRRMAAGLVAGAGLLIFVALFLRGDDLPGKTENAGGAGEAEVVFLADRDGNEMVNLSVQDGVRVTADSTEAEQFAPEKAADGNRTDSASRWSSANVPGEPEHWLMLEFDSPQEVSFVRIWWERLNVLGFVIEVSDNGTDWITAAEWEGTLLANEQTVILEQTHSCHFLRLRTTAVSETEENQYLYYQNVSVMELEVYPVPPMSYCLEQAVVETAPDGSRHLVLPKVPEGFELGLAGVDYEQIIGEDGTVYPTVEEKTVQAGFWIRRSGEEASGADGENSAVEYEESPAYSITVPAGGILPDILQQTAGNLLPEQESSDVDVEAAEWQPGSGMLPAAAVEQIIVDPRWQQEGGEETEAFLEKWEDRTGRKVQVVYRDEPFGKNGEMTEGATLFLGVAEEELGLGEEGYLCSIGEDGIVLLAGERQGLVWGLNQLLALAEETELPCGILRDYPLYAVRGFSIDIGRKMISLETLERMVEALSAAKMNTLGIHLNDNEILSTSGKNDSIANAFTAYSGFRLESDLGLASGDGALTKEEWKEFSRWAASKGVEVVPEIDTPAHSLAITKLFPEAALATDPENVDQLDLGRKETVELAEQIWKEYLEGEEPVFSGKTVHIGMDEYYGDGEDYRSYMNRMISLAEGYGHSVRMWGSTSRISGTERIKSENIQVQVWSTEWADPVETYREGFTVINSLSSLLYIIPGGGYDHLDLEALADWEPWLFPDGGSAQALPVYSPRVAGSIYCLWNDYFDSGEEITEEDIYERFEEPLSLLSGKLW